MIVERINKRLIDRLYKEVSFEGDWDIVDKSTVLNYLLEPLEYVKKISEDTGIFLDLGSGIGSVMLLAKKILLEYEVHGIDNNPNYIEFTKNLGFSNSHFYDMLCERSNRLISEASIIYAYNPLYPAETEQLFKNLRKYMSSGTYFIYNFEHSVILEGFDIIKIYKHEEFQPYQNITIFKKQ